jgi:O-antigen/teichoic acid export membrane protein
MLDSISKHYFSAAIGWLSRLVSAGSQIVTIPIIFHYLGVHDYAVFVIIAGLIAWFNLSDFGIGYALQNKLSEQRALQKEYKTLLAKANHLIFWLFIVEVISFSALSPWLQKKLFVSVSSNLPWPVFAATGSLYLALSMFGIAYKVLFAEQKAYIAYLYQLFGVLASILLSVLFSRYVPEHRLAVITVGWVLPQALAALIAFIQVFPFRRSSLDLPFYFALIASAWRFSAFSFFSALVLAVDYIIASRVLSAIDIIIYNSISRVFNVIYFGYSALLAVIWPVMAEALVKAESTLVHEANRLLLRNIAIGVVCIMLFTGLLAYFREYVAHFIGSSEINIHILVVVLFGIYYSLRVWTDTYAMALQAANRMKVFLYAVPVQAALSIVLLYFLGKMYGLAGMMVGMVLCFALTVSWLLPMVHSFNVKQVLSGNS